MQRELIIAELKELIEQLGTNGGLNSPSVYDTAQVLRFAPPAEGIDAALAWLLAQQQADGGWGDPATPRTRDVVTLSVLLLLNAHQHRPGMRAMIAAGLDFVREHANIWEGPLPEDLPVGIELLLPRLLDDAAAVGLELPFTHYQAIRELGVRRLQRIEKVYKLGNRTIEHSWEAWGNTATHDLIDGAGSVGHNPAATAAWLKASAQRKDLAAGRVAARAYLDQASRATKMGIPGVVPGVWPINRFEQIFGLYALAMNGLLDHPALHDVVQRQIANLMAAFTPAGIGLSDWFIPDGDDTAAALTLMHMSGYHISLAPLLRFADGEHFCAYPGEMQASTSLTAHAVHTLSLKNYDITRQRAYLLERQSADGRWGGDKWHTSWLYTTSRVLIALQGELPQAALERAINSLLTCQHTDGGWGVRGSTAEETAFGLVALQHLPEWYRLSPMIQQAYARAGSWLQAAVQAPEQQRVANWIDKDMYRPYRIVRLVELAALASWMEYTMDGVSMMQLGSACLTERILFNDHHSCRGNCPCTG